MLVLDHHPSLLENDQIDRNTYLITDSYIGYLTRMYSPHEKESFIQVSIYSLF